MAIAHSQVYLFNHWTRSYDGDADGVTKSIVKEWWYRFKEAFVAGGWTVMGSYAGTGSVFNDGDRDLVDGLGAGAGTDTWTGPNFSAGGNNRPWIILQCPPIMGKAQFMFGCSQPFQSNPEYMDARVSLDGTFMTLYGGTNGTTSARPTAPDQVIHNTNQGGLNNAGAYSTEVHACWSTLKDQFYIMTKHEQATPMFMAFSVLDNAPVNLADGLAYCALFGDTGLALSNTKMDNADHYTTPNWRGQIDGVTTQMYLGGRGWSNVGIQSQLRIPDDGKIVGGPCELYGSPVTYRNYYGTVPDIYWTPNSQYNQGYGDSVAGPIKWYSGGSIIVPWDATQKLPRLR
jgi:hypothetical protein